MNRLLLLIAAFGTLALMLSLRPAGFNDEPDHLRQTAHVECFDPGKAWCR